MIDEILDTRVGNAKLAIFWLGQNSFILKNPEGTLIAIDPYFSRTSGFSYIHSEPPILPEEVLVDYVFCTHDHLDHTDPETLPGISKSSPKTVFLGPTESHNHFRRMGIPSSRARSLRANTTVKLGDFEVTPVNSILGSEVNRKGERWTTHYGYVFNFGFVKLYNMGDSSPEVVAAPMKVLKDVIPFSPEIAIFPIIGDFPGRKPEDAISFARILKPKIVIPSHYDCFPDRTIDPKVFVELFRDEPDILTVVIEYKGKYVYKA